MIQACSRCGTRWNVRDRRRDVCPRCGGALLAPVAGAAPQQNRPAQGARIPAGYRWIAVRPGAAPRGTTTIIVALFFLSGIQLLFIGMLGEYITAIHNQVRGGPMVIESERLNVAPEDMPRIRLTGTRA